MKDTMHALRIIASRRPAKPPKRKPRKAQRYSDWILTAQPGQRR